MKSLVYTEELCSGSVPLEHAPGAKSLVRIGLLRPIRNHDGDVNENDNNAIGLDLQNNNFASSIFCTFLRRCCTTTT